MLVLVDYYSYNNYIIIVVTSLIMIIMAITVSLALALVTLQKLPVGAHAPSIFQACCLVKKFRPCFAASGGA